MVVDLAREVGVLLARGLEHDLETVSCRVPQSPIPSSVGRTLEPLVSLCDARYTLPKEPFPISRPSV